MNTSWMLGALCAHPEVRDLPWTAEDASSWDRVRMAKVCAACPVLAACDVATATTETTAGFWAGHDRTVPDLADLPDAEPVEQLHPVQDTLPGLEHLGRAA
ncbi:hypothetical protein [Antribacter gilvus]|uniref:hypothetical protein n=1 Tax=Antribacter gilvus TaxID=2304675 RepID=UPI000F7AA60D|nr:hypothetical protein [Antribacter gilvus]